MSSIASVPTVDINFRSSYQNILAQAWQMHLQPRSNDAPTVISTFAGGGGSSLGYSIAGYRELLAVEWDKNAVETFRLNFPDVPVYFGDITQLSVNDILQRTSLQVGELDVLDGSPPCQGFSTAGKRMIDDPRNQLFREYVRILQGLRPKVFVMENVSGMVKGKMKLLFAEILQELKSCGYRVSARLLNAKYFHVPQSRDRMIFVGVRNDLNVNPSHPAARSHPITLRTALQDIADLGQLSPRLTDLQIKNWSETKRGESHHTRFSTYRRTILKEPGSGGHMHPDEARLLHIGELKRIGSFPDEFTFAGSWTNACNRIGNSVPPLLMQAIASHIRHKILTTTTVD